MNKRKEAIRELHDRATECPGRVADGTCDGLCGWTAGLFAAYTAGRTKRDEVVQTLTDERIAHLEAALHVAVEQLEEVRALLGEALVWLGDDGDHTDEPGSYDHDERGCVCHVRERIRAALEPKP
jgi:hypothetical protein